ncbi:nitroreductase family protein [Pectobacterium parmentieri]|uniref:Nitroreductase n=1 Tax=Pectobacterium parmentieri TaxID=1905730 RepID=A0A0H3I852_PECPM|nr:nitroreductase family protein [Pectobacterium parmentieri]ACX88724.1 nitroreductase [Pectobacterium parmentieri WPP163]AFI91045.1 Nitroreductase [Pectobacterium parmentieri]AOR58026.1 nitroreductase [Pectobacterium parmentieri]AYH02137.1 nitroreductase [Pectobacterium parmentieri]AYH06400.1 nitroreductase [Pectobacterium parmentieri]
MSNAFLQSIKARRSIYAIGNKLPIPEDQVTALITEAVNESPSAFNSQSSRVVILFGEQHHKLWDIVKQQLKKIVPADAFASTENKLASFAAGAGTVLFFEDTSVIEALQEKFALYADNFPVWSEHSTGIAQAAVWSTLAQEKIGASLQHYNPLIDNDVKAQWDLPASWKLRAQMPFGSIEQPAGEKTYIAFEERFRVFK